MRFLGDFFQFIYNADLVSIACLQFENKEILKLRDQIKFLKMKEQVPKTEPVLFQDTVKHKINTYNFFHFWGESGLPDQWDLENFHWKLENYA